MPKPANQTDELSMSKQLAGYYRNLWKSQRPILVELGEILEYNPQMLPSKLAQVRKLFIRAASQDLMDDAIEDLFSPLPTVDALPPPRTQNLEEITVTDVLACHLQDLFPDRTIVEEKGMGIFQVYMGNRYVQIIVTGDGLLP